MLLAINIVMILIGTATAAISLIGDTWDEKNRRFTRIGLVSFFGFLLFMVLSIWKEVITTQEGIILQKVDSSNRYVNEVAIAFSKYSIEKMHIEVILDPVRVDEVIKDRGYVQTDVYFSLSNNVQEAEIVNFYLIPLLEHETAEYQQDLVTISKDIPNIKNLIQSYRSGDYIQQGDKLVLFYKTIGKDSWESYPLKNVETLYGNPPLNFSLERWNENLPSSIEGFLGQEMVIYDRDKNALSKSVISEIKFFHDPVSAIPFLVLRERVREPYGNNHWVWRWFPTNATLVRKMVEGHMPGFLFDLRSFKEEFIKSIQE
jgi:hypothetical protein